VTAILLAILLFAFGRGGTSSEAHPVEPLENVHDYRVGPYQILVGEAADGSWSWRVYDAAVWAESDDPTGTELAAGYDAADQADALKRAKAWVDARLEEQKPGAGAPMQAHGLRVSADCGEIQVVDIEQWLAFATPLVRSYEADPLLADDVARVVLDAALPECGLRDRSAKPKIRGTSWDTTMARAQSTIDSIISGELLSVQPPEQVAAARLVGMSAPSVPGSMAEWHTGENNGNVHAIIVTPNRPKEDFLWRVWKGPRRDREDILKFGFSPTRSQAMRDAKQWADMYFNMGVSP
jgi:hypothetical protein